MFFHLSLSTFFNFNFGPRFIPEHLRNVKIFNVAGTLNGNAVFTFRLLLPLLMFCNLCFYVPPSPSLLFS